MDEPFFTDENYPYDEQGLSRFVKDCFRFKAELEADQWSMERIDCFAKFITDDENEQQLRWFVASDVIHYLVPKFYYLDIPDHWSAGIHYLLYKTRPYRATRGIGIDWSGPNHPHNRLYSLYLDSMRAVGRSVDEELREFYDADLEDLEEKVKGLTKERDYSKHPYQHRLPKTDPQGMFPDDETSSSTRRSCSPQFTCTRSHHPTLTSVPTPKRSPSPASIRSTSRKPVPISKKKSLKKLVKTCIRRGSVLFSSAHVEEGTK